MRPGVLALWLVAAACGPQGCGDGRPNFRPVLEDLEGAVLSFWGTSAKELFAVGGTLMPNGGRAIALRHDGRSWRSLPVDAPTLWWVHGFAPDDVWAVGELGTVAHFDGTSWRVIETGADYTLWGIWGLSPDEMWAVGGRSAPDHRGTLRRFDGVAWSDVAGVDLDGVLLFKVWGATADDVWAVGERGTLLHWDGVAWTKLPALTDQRLLTVIGRSASDVHAVGGLGQGVVLRFDGASWSTVEVGSVIGLMGVWTARGQRVLAVGFAGAAVWGDGAEWHILDPGTERCLHVAWGDGRGVLVAGGGDLFSTGPRRGVVVASGEVASGPLAP